MKNLKTGICQSCRSRSKMFATKERRRSIYWSSHKVWSREEEKSNKRSASTIVDEVNKKHKININERTVRTYVAKGLTKPPRKSGGKEKVPIEVRNALLSTLKTVINLECAGMKHQPNCSQLIKMLKSCLKKCDTFTYGSSSEKSGATAIASKH